MATVAATKGGNGSLTWSGVVTGDTLTEAKITGGYYNLEIKGTWGGATAKMLYSLATGPTVGMIDGTTEFTATSDTGVRLVGPIAEGYVKPSISGGSANSLTYILYPAPVRSKGY